VVVRKKLVLLAVVALLPALALASASVVEVVRGCVCDVYDLPCVIDLSPCIFFDDTFVCVHEPSCICFGDICVCALDFEGFDFDVDMHNATITEIIELEDIILDLRNAIIEEAQ